MAAYKGFEIELHNTGLMSCNELGFSNCASWDVVTNKIDKHLAGIKKGFPSYKVFRFSFRNDYEPTFSETGLIHNRSRISPEIWVKDKSGRHVLYVNALYKDNDQNRATLEAITEKAAEVKANQAEIKALVESLDKFEVTEEMFKLAAELDKQRR